MELSQNWLLMALLTPTLWAVNCLVDSCLVGGRVYRKAADGAIVSCLFGALPVLAVLGWSAAPSVEGSDLMMLPPGGIAAGLAYALHLACYFRVLFRLNDVSGAETFLLLSVLIVPLFAFVLLGEALPARYYLAFAIAAAGVSLQCLPVLRRAGASVAFDLIVCVLAVSLSMVLQSHALETRGYASATLAFNLTLVAAALVPLALGRRVRERIVALARRVPLVLLASELLGTLAVLSSHRATEYGPSVSVVALLECLLPLIIVLVSLTALGVNRVVPVLTRDHRKTLRRQTRNVPSKSLALLAVSVSLLTLSG